MVTVYEYKNSKILNYRPVLDLEMSKKLLRIASIFPDGCKECSPL